MLMALHAMRKLAGFLSNVSSTLRTLSSSQSGMGVLGTKSLRLLWGMGQMGHCPVNVAVVKIQHRQSFSAAISGKPILTGKG
jgi:hypothetical protein